MLNLWSTGILSSKKMRKNSFSARSRWHKRTLYGRLTHKKRISNTGYISKGSLGQVCITSQANSCQGRNLWPTSWSECAWTGHALAISGACTSCQVTSRAWTNHNPVSNDAVLAWHMVASTHPCLRLVLPALLAKEIELTTDGKVDCVHRWLCARLA